MTPEDMVLTPTGLRFAGRMWPCSVGRGGVRLDKREGDGATPAGVHRIVGLLYRPDRMARPVDWALPIRPSDLWSDDPACEDYNLMVRAPYAGSHERLRRGDRLYDLVILTDWNWPRAERGRGSAIFLHRWRWPGFATEGCLAFRPDHLAAIARRITYATRLIVPEPLAGR
ncbi:L,D-transpeptidase family protein [Maliponia aquimaris]|uniref:L,D-transpeptidase catalytic domain n=1 Tax=Maliponia aquimaris TaxID=1673631 RepID=A0A238K7F0_9RHOB|nr:L,D-transpeptidase family protein [Maliponia aquimaris]SMX38407.1 L,D-transpeptidase catalytic domain [Maliponia aquimaris]